MNASAWTPDLAAQLAHCRANKMSFGEIALLGIFVEAGLNRNACIGKANRLGLSPVRTRGLGGGPAIIKWSEEMDDTLRANWAAYGCGDHMVALLSIPSASIYYRAKKLGLPKRPHNVGRDYTQRRVKIDRNVPPPATCKRLTILELEANSCRWPMWHKPSDPFHYCGNDKQEGTSYCSYHAAVGTQPCR